MKTRVLIGTGIWNEGNKFLRLAEKMEIFLAGREDDPDFEWRMLVVDDGSDDGVYEKLARGPDFDWIRHQTNRGAGAVVRAIYEHGRSRGFDVAATIAGNGKDDPAQLPRLIEPITSEGYDLVQGSRYLAGGGFGNMPGYRVAATRYVHPILMSFFTGKKITDSTNGFRALRLSILDDPRIDLDQQWLDRYELEPYLLYQALRLGYKVKEVPVTKVYPSPEEGYTKIKPVTGWWSILRPLFLLKAGIKK